VRPNAASPARLVGNRHTLRPVFPAIARCASCNSLRGAPDALGSAHSLPAAYGMLAGMKAGMSRVRGVMAGETVKRTLLGGGLFGVSQGCAGLALGCLVVWVALALTITLLWALVAFIASLIPL